MIYVTLFFGKLKSPTCTDTYSAQKPWFHNQTKIPTHLKIHTCSKILKCQAPNHTKIPMIEIPQSLKHPSSFLQYLEIKYGKQDRNNETNKLIITV